MGGKVEGKIQNTNIYAVDVFLISIKTRNVWE